MTWLDLIMNIFLDEAGCSENLGVWAKLKRNLGGKCFYRTFTVSAITFKSFSFYLMQIRGRHCIIVSYLFIWLQLIYKYLQLYVIKINIGGYFSMVFRTVSDIQIATYISRFYFFTLSIFRVASYLQFRYLIKLSKDYVSKRC